MKTIPSLFLFFYFRFCSSIFSFCLYVSKESNFAIRKGLFHVIAETENRFPYPKLIRPKKKI